MVAVQSRRIGATGSTYLCAHFNRSGGLGRGKVTYSYEERISCSYIISPSRGYSLTGNIF